MANTAANNPANTNASTINRAQPNRSQATTTAAKGEAPANVLVVASAKGFDSSAGVTINEGQEFYVTREQAKRGATWFDVKDESLRDVLDAERAKDEAKAAKKGTAKKADTDTDDLA